MILWFSYLGLIVCTNTKHYSTSLSIYFIMLLQDQRDLQQHAIVIQEVELSEEAISVRLSVPSLHAIPQQCDLLLIKSNNYFPIIICIIPMYGDHHNYEWDVGYPVVQVD